ncbi:MAG: nitroreductase family protein [Clostridium fessum]
MDPDEIDRKLIDEIIYSATLAPSAKNRQPWKFIVYQGEEKDKLVEVMRHGINSEK